MSDRAFRIWQRVLLAVSVGLALFGVLAAVAPFAPPFTLRNAAIADAYFGGAWTEAGRAYHAFAAGPLGGTIAGFFAMQAWVVAVPFARRERWAWWAVATGTAVWFVVDSAVSLAHGAAFNVVQVNLVSLALVGVPLAATWRAFRSSRVA